MENCRRCFLPIHRYDPKDYYGDHANHKPDRCAQLLRAEIAAKDARIAELEAKTLRLGPLCQRVMEWHDLIESEQDLDDSAGDGISVRDVLLKEMEDAVDAANGE